MCSKCFMGICMLTFYPQFFSTWTIATPTPNWKVRFTGMEIFMDNSLIHMCCWLSARHGVWTRLAYQTVLKNTADKTDSWQDWSAIKVTKMFKKSTRKSFSTNLIKPLKWSLEFSTGQNKFLILPACCTKTYFTCLLYQDLVYLLAAPSQAESTAQSTDLFGWIQSLPALRQEFCQLHIGQVRVFGLHFFTVIPYVLEICCQGFSWLVWVLHTQNAHVWVKTLQISTLYL